MTGSGGAARGPAAGRQAPYAAHPGTVRPSQLITTFGPGSIIQTKNDSVVVMGPDSWARPSQNYKVLRHAYLEALLGKTHFRMPVAGDHRMVVSCSSFPTWGVCSNPKCRILQRHRGAPPRGRPEFACDRCRSPLHPARFIVMCEKGHLDDFPWREWAHSKSKSECAERDPVLRMRAMGKSTALSDYYVSCDSCGARRNCGMAVSAGGLDGIVDRCSGLSPWLDGRTGACTGGQNGGPARPRGIQTLSTSLYYPSTVSALYIPRLLHPIRRAIDEHKEAIDGALAMNSPREIAEQHPLLAAVRDRYGAGEVAAHLEGRYAPAGADGSPITKASSEADVRRIEYEDLTAHAEFHDGGEDLEISTSRLGAGASEYLSSLRQATRLTEITAIRSFTRGIAPDPHSPEDAAEIRFCPIAARPMDWYPAVENRGEGLLLSLREDRLREWEGRAGVQERCSATIEAADAWARSNRWARRERPSPRYLLLHTVSHMLNRELSKRAGYSEASIRERLYCGGSYNAILLYTASSSSDGSLGGLVRQGDPDAFWRLLRSAVRRARSCSGDPPCADDDPVAKRDDGIPVQARLNGSACYGCALLPETSCENANRLLDRMLVVGGGGLGFFSGLE